MAACPSCGEANPAHARFCLACGKPLEAEPAPAREIRKTVTIVFCDLIDSTPLGERLDAETYRRVISRYFVEVSAVLERHGGTVEKFIGDAVMAVFGIPTVHEDDALRAVRAAAELREALARLNEALRDDLGVELGIRIGVNTGEVVAGDPYEGQAFATGEAVAVAQRLEAAAGSGEILIGESTQQLVRDAILAEPVEGLALKGVADTTAAWRLLGVVSGAPAFARRLDSPLVGRGHELALLRQAFHRSVEERSCHLFTVLGSAGVGKSRLVNELLEQLGSEARVLIGRCLPYGEGITFWPLRDIVHQAAALTQKLSPEEARSRIAELVADDPESDVCAERLAAATGLAEGEASNEEIFWAMRKLLEAMAQERPVIVGFDDVQWAEPTFLDLIDHLSDWTRNAPVLLVCLARPELLDDRPAWGGGKMNATSILLEPLRADDVDRLVQNQLGDVPDEIKRMLLKTAEGNPLFVEEMLAMLVEQGRLVPENGRWRSVEEPEAAETPPTIQALLAARLDRLDSESRDLLECAAVIGKVFSSEALRSLVDLDDRHLASLVRKDLIRPDRSGASDDLYRFRHILIRDAAYQALAKDRRAVLHERFADWLHDAGTERRREYEEILGFHLEQAHRYRAELEPAGERTGELAARAAEHLSSAGRRALARGDASAAAGLLTRATILLRDDDVAALQFAPELGIALREIGELTRAEGVLSRATELAKEKGERALEMRAKIEQAHLRMRLDPAFGVEPVGLAAEEAIPVFQELGDDLGLAKSWIKLADVHWMAARWSSVIEALEQALVYAQKAGDHREESSIQGRLALALIYGATPVPEAIERVEQALAEATGHRSVEGRLVNALANLKAMNGEFEEARGLYARGQQITGDLGLRLWLALQTLTGAEIEFFAGDPAAAEAELRSGIETLERMGEMASLSTMSAFLAQIVVLQDRLDEAEALTEVSEAAAALDDAASQTMWRGTRAHVFARRGELDAAKSMAREAVAIAQGTDDLQLLAFSKLSLAQVLDRAGETAEARSLLEEALDLYEQKGNVAARKLAAQALAGLGATS